MVRLASRIAELETGRVPFVHATVVRAERPTSAHPGDEAVILADGSIEGFVGGQCARGSVLVAALDVLASGEAVLLRVLPDDSDPFPDTPGARVAVNPCLSGGSLEIFLRPRLPAPLVHVIGDSPIADALVALTATMGYDSRHGHADMTGATAVVLCEHGLDEAGAIRQALAAGVDFIGLVASPRRGAAVLDEMGLTPKERVRVRTPVGLWIGARTPAEIALSIVAEIVEAMRLGDLGVAADRAADGPPTTTRPVRVVDPVCGMTVIVGADTPHAVVQGHEHWFCGPGCRDHYVAAAAS